MSDSQEERLKKLTKSLLAMPHKPREESKLGRRVKESLTDSSKEESGGAPAKKNRRPKISKR